MQTLRISTWLAAALCGLGLSCNALAAEVRNGDWTIHKSEAPGKIEFGLVERHGSSYSNDEEAWPVDAFSGMDWSKAGRHDVQFRVSRDAGSFECEGSLKDGEGAGTFRFVPDPGYAREMQSLGFPVDSDKQYLMAALDVSREFARRMKAEQLSGLDADKLISFRIHGVDADFIDGLRSASLAVTDSDRLVEFRIHGVTPQMVRDLHQAGYTPDEEMLIAMRIHGATPEWIAALKGRGYDHVELQRLIDFRIHGVSPEFIGQLQSLGYSHPAPEELVNLRIHNVTPEYIADLRSHGLQNLSLDKLVELRIQGID